MSRGRRTLIAVFAIVLAAVGASACTDDGGGSGESGAEVTARVCQMSTDCQGSLDGSWRTVGLCGDGTFDVNGPAIGELVEGKVTDLSGYVQFHSDTSDTAGTYELSSTATSHQIYDIDVPTSHNAPEDYCAEIETQYSSTFDTNCQLTADGKCRCVFVTTQTANDNGSYSTDGNGTLTMTSSLTGTDRTATYCARGDVLHLGDDSDSSTGASLLTSEVAFERGMPDADQPDAGQPDTSQDTGSPETSGTFAVTIDGHSLDLPNLSVSQVGSGLAINATSADGGTLFGITLGDPSVGTHQCLALTSMSYSTNQGSTTYQTGTCELDITTAEEGHIAGTFEATLDASQGGSGSVTATNGSFDVTY